MVTYRGRDDSGTLLFLGFLQEIHRFNFNFWIMVLCCYQNIVSFLFSKPIMGTTVSQGFYNTFSYKTNLANKHTVIDFQ